MCGLVVQSVDCMHLLLYEDIMPWEPEDPWDPLGPSVRRLVISSQFCWTLYDMVCFYSLGKLWASKRCWVVIWQIYVSLKQLFSAFQSLRQKLKANQSEMLQCWTYFIFNRSPSPFIWSLHRTLHYNTTKVSNDVLHCLTFHPQLHALLENRNSILLRLNTFF